MPRSRLLITSNKGNWGSYGSPMTDSRAGSGNILYKMSLRHLAVLESKNVLKKHNDGSMSKGHRSH